jgi:hypothetical protein
MPKDFDLDAVLAAWRAPSRDAAAWSAQAGATVLAVAKAEPLAESELAALLEPPSLSDETAPDASALQLAIPDVVRDSSGERNMSDDREPSSEAPRKRQSLKEIAARASQSGRASLTSIPPASATSTPLPRSETARASIPPGSIRSPASMRPAASSRPSEANADDSGVVDLKAVQASATPAQVDAAANAKPGAHGLLDDDEPKKAAPAVAAASVAASPPKKSGAVVGIAIAAVGIAAALFIVMRSGPEASSAASASAAAEVAPVAQADKAMEPTPAAAPSPTAEAVAQADSPEPSASAAPSVEPTAGKVAPSGPAAPVAVAAADTAAPAEIAPKPAAPAEPAQPGDLAAAMAKAAGASAADKSGASSEKVEPAARGNNANIPKQPPQGSVTSAIGSVMGGAKACVAGADEVSRAQLTFGSSGAVSNVSVSGWAAANGKTGCVKSAMKGAKVGPFQDPSFSVGVTIRP